MGLAHAPLAGIASFSLLLSSGSAPAQDRASQGSESLGKVVFPISCAPSAHARFERAVALLHHMMYVEAKREFEAVSEIDPQCAMSHWGIAVTLFQPLWPTRPGPAELKAGWQEVQRAGSIGGMTERERAYVAAVEAFYREPEGADYATRLRRFEERMEAVYRAYPDDMEARYTASILSLATASQSDKTLAHQYRAAQILDRVYAREPAHPGAIHYAIHAHDVDGFAGEGLAVARGYDDIAPHVPHALHMPTHIFVRLGAWPDVIEWNRRSADAAVNFPAGRFTSHHYAHALDYLMYAHLQRAEDWKARAVLEETISREDYQETFISAYALAAIPARYAVERRDWSLAAALPERTPPSFPWQRFPGAEAMTHFARGLGAARSGDPAGARRSLERLELLREAAAGGGDDYWAQQVEIQRLALEAWTAHAEGRGDQAIGLMRSSASLERSTEKHPVTPGALQPAYELLGDLLWEQSRPADALEAYEASLETWPGRFHSLLGAARAADRVGNGPKAKSYYQQLIELAEGAEADRAGLAEARAYLARAGR